MAEIINNNPSSEYENFLVYPDFQEAFKGHSGLYGVILDYKAQFKRIYETMDRIRDWKSDEMLLFSRERFRQLAKKAKTEEQRVEYQNLSEILTPEDNYELARQLYEANLDILDRYSFAYYDIRCREESKQNSTSIVTPVFNRLSEPIAMNLNLELEFDSRFKTWFSAVQKMITKSELLDLTELQSFNDIYACRFIVSSGVSSDELRDYEGAERDCYKTMNTVLRHIEKIGGRILPAKSVGDTSEQIWPEYRSCVKDYINNPKSNGFKSLHAYVEVPIAKNRIIKFEIHVESCFMAFQNELLAPHISHKANTKLDLVFDPTLVRLRKFYAGVRPDGSLLIVDRGEGLLEPKELSAHKWYHIH